MWSIFLFALLVCFADYSKEKAINDKINAMLDYCNSVNSSVSNNMNSGNNNTNNENNIVTEQIYFDGKTALADAYKNFYVDSNSFNVFASGNLSLSAPAGLYAKVQMDIVMQRYSKTKAYEEVLVCPIEANIPSGLTSKLSSGCKRLKEGSSNPLIIFTSKSKFEGTRIVADYTNKNSNPRAGELFYNDNYLIINEETIKEITYFKLNKKGNEIKNYYIQAKLDVKKTVENYAVILSKQIGCEKPKFKSITVTAILDGKGNLLSLSSLDYFDISLFGFNCSANTNFTFKVSGINEKNNFVYTGF